ncbi:MAG: flavin reductase family protein [Planctomycetes bacterium]|nr:flavin reductase family protein [Planctomycetota bacterium]
MNVDAVQQVFQMLDPELWVVTAAAGGRRGGLIATSVTAASIVLELPRIRMALANQHHTHGLVRTGRAFAVHLFDESRLDWVWRFALAHGRDVDKFDGVAWRTSDLTGAPLLEEALCWLDCVVEAELDIGDRTVFVGEVVDGAVLREGRPLTASRMAELAPPERLDALREDIGRDAAIDAKQIRRWRREFRRG